MRTGYSNFTIEPAPGWLDVTDEVLGDGVPITLARADGCGALQFSVASYRSGPVPGANTETLLHLLHDFAQKRELGLASDSCGEGRPLYLAAASFKTDSFIRVWYVSDGCNVALATYFCDPKHAANELADCEQMVRTLQIQ